MLKKLSGKTLNLTSTLAVSTALLGCMLTNASYAMEPDLNPQVKVSQKSLTDKSPQSDSNTYTVPSYVKRHDPAKYDPATGYPKISPSLTLIPTASCLIDTTQTTSKRPHENFTIAEKLRKEKNTSCNIYYEAVILHPDTPSILRDAAMIKRAEVFLNAYSSLCPIVKEPILTTLWAENLRCLHFLNDKPKTFEDQKGSVRSTLAEYYLMGGPFSPLPKNVKYFMLEALKHKLPPLDEAHLLTNVAALYYRGELGSPSSCGGEALKYWGQVSENDSFPSRQRLDAKLGLANILFRYGELPTNNIETVKRLLQEVLNHQEQGVLEPSQEWEFYQFRKRAESLAARLKLKEYHHARTLPSLLDAFVALFPCVGDAEKSILQKNCLLPFEEIQGLRTDYAENIFTQYFHHDTKFYDATHPLYRKNLLYEILDDIVYQENQSVPDYRARAIIIAAQIMSKENINCKNLPFLRKKNMNQLLESILDDCAISSRFKDEAKAIKTVLVAKELLPRTANRQDLVDLNEVLKSPHIDAVLKLEVLKVLSAKTVICYPTYNKEIGKIVEYLKEALKQERDLICQKTIQFVLYTYFQAYKECLISPDEAVQYVESLSSEDTPEAFRILITTDEDSEEEIEPKVLQEIQEGAGTEFHGNESPQPLQNTIPSIELPQPEGIEQIVSVTSAQPPEDDTIDGINPLEEDWQAMVFTPPPVVAPNPLPAPLPDLTPQQVRNLRNAEFLLARLTTKRGKVDQSEVSNMLRRLEYTFQPTADNGLTLHLGHKGRKNKKGTPGRLDGGRKSDLAAVLEDAIHQVEQ